MTIQLAVRLPEEHVEALDAVVASGRYKNRTAAIVGAIKLLREAELVEAYRRAAARPLTGEERELDAFLDAANRSTFRSIEAEEAERE
jgi:Arc/MetJ-type ribon-helix-helix transcriptional regulator